jgi:hypothetical protein
VAVFFGQSKDVSVRLRASNLGLFVGHDEGVTQLVRAALKYVDEFGVAPRAARSTSFRIGAPATHDICRRVVV